MEPDTAIQTRLRHIAEIVEFHESATATTDALIDPQSNAKFLRDLAAKFENADFVMTSLRPAQGRPTDSAPAARL